MDFHKTQRVLWGDKWSEVNEHLLFLNSNRSDLEIQGHICYIYYCLTLPQFLLIVSNLQLLHDRLKDSAAPLQDTKFC